jgi:hypothetical protein
MYEQTRSNCFRLMIAPMSVASSSGSPIFKADSLSASFARKDSKIERWRNTRDPAVHDWP